MPYPPVNKMTRNEVIRELQGMWSIQCYDYESIKTLRQALKEARKTG